MSSNEDPVPLSDDELDMVVGGNGIPVSPIAAGSGSFSVAGDSLSMGAVLEAMSADKNLEGSIRSFQQTMDPNSQMDLIQLQKMMQDWTVQTQLQSNVVKSMGDALKNTVTKLR